MLGGCHVSPVRGLGHWQHTSPRGTHPAGWGEPRGRRGEGGCWHVASAATSVLRHAVPACCCVPVRAGICTSALNPPTPWDLQAGFAHMTQRLLKFAAGRMVCVLEGGYVPRCVPARLLARWRCSAWRAVPSPMQQAAPCPSSVSHARAHAHARTLAHTRTCTHTYLGLFHCCNPPLRLCPWARGPACVHRMVGECSAAVIDVLLGGTPPPMAGRFALQLQSTTSAALKKVHKAHAGFWCVPMHARGSGGRGGPGAGCCAGGPCT